MMLIPILKNKTRRKVLIGEDLSSHFNNEVLRLCAERNITLIAPPANTNHLL